MKDLKKNDKSYLKLNININIYTDVNRKIKTIRYVNIFPVINKVNCQSKQ